MMDDKVHSPARKRVLLYIPLAINILLIFLVLLRPIPMSATYMLGLALLIMLATIAYYFFTYLVKRQPENKVALWVSVGSLAGLLVFFQLLTDNDISSIFVNFLIKIPLLYFYTPFSSPFVPGFGNYDSYMSNLSYGNDDFYMNTLIICFIASLILVGIAIKMIMGKDSKSRKYGISILAFFVLLIVIAVLDSNITKRTSLAMCYNPWLDIEKCRGSDNDRVSSCLKPYTYKTSERCLNSYYTASTVINASNFNQEFVTIKYCTDNYMGYRQDLCLLNIPPISNQSDFNSLGASFRKSDFYDVKRCDMILNRKLSDECLSRILKLIYDRYESAQKYYSSFAECNKENRDDEWCRNLVSFNLARWSNDPSYCNTNQTDERWLKSACHLT